MTEVLKALIFFVLFVLVIIEPVEVNAQIYICVDTNSQRHYSDKKCPQKKRRQEGSIDKTGKAHATSNVKMFSSVLRLLKRSYALLTIYEPGNQEYSELYNRVTTAELKHMRFLSNPIRSQFSNYNPLGKQLQKRVIQSISDACRNRGYFSVCATIEGNPWISQTERDEFLSDMENKYASVSEDNSLCDRAVDANTGGVISDEMKTFFCRK